MFKNSILFEPPIFVKSPRLVKRKISKTCIFCWNVQANQPAFGGIHVVLEVPYAPSKAFLVIFISL